PIRTFSVGFSETEYSELGYARAVSKIYQTNHHELEVTPQDYLKFWPEALLRRGAPVSEPADIPILQLSHMARQSVKMVLTGEGSDELLGGYPKHIAEGWAPVYQRFVPSAIHDRFVLPIVNALPYGARRVKILARAAGEPDFCDRMRLWFGGLSLAERFKILGKVTSNPIDPYPFSLHRASALRRILFFDQTSWLPDNLLERGDRMMMAGSIEGRMPFMDIELARVVARFPDNFLIGHPKGKAVLRVALTRFLPKEILTRKKVGFRVPVNKWFQGPFREVVHDLLTGAASEMCRVCGAATISSFVNEHMRGEQNHERILWMLTNLELFIRTFKPSMGQGII